MSASGDALAVKSSRGGLTMQKESYEKPTVTSETLEAGALASTGSGDGPAQLFATALSFIGCCCA